MIGPLTWRDLPWRRIAAAVVTVLGLIGTAVMLRMLERGAP